MRPAQPSHVKTASKPAAVTAKTAKAQAAQKAHDVNQARESLRRELGRFEEIEVTYRKAGKFIERQHVSPTVFLPTITAVYGTKEGHQWEERLWFGKCTYFYDKEMYFRGKHKELMGTSEVYREIVLSQLSEEEIAG